MTDEFVPKDHPRAESLRIRHAIIDGLKDKVVAEAGLIAHGRGEALDYLIGEKTNSFAKKAIEAAAALLLLAEHPVFSVNGNIAALVPDETIALSKAVPLALEVNLFYRTREREEAIAKVFTRRGVPKDSILGIALDQRKEIDEITHNRRIVDTRGIDVADVVFVPLEDGDRTEALVSRGQKVITIDLNPLSRTAQKSHVTIVDNLVRAMPLLVDQVNQMSSYSKDQLEEVITNYDNALILKEAEQAIRSP
jgi:4-phosphopantoate--beta-alanine ligase